MSGSRTITADDDRLDNVHPGDILREDFLIGTELPVADVAAATCIDRSELEAVLAGCRSVSADTDLRLGAYFGMSRGFFLRLQNAFDLEEVERTSGSEIKRIRPYAEQAV